MDNREFIQKYEKIMEEVMLLSTETKDKTEGKFLLAIYNNICMSLANRGCQYAYEGEGRDELIHIYTESGAHYKAKKISVVNRLKKEYDNVFKPENEISVKLEDADVEDYEDESDYDEPEEVISESSSTKEAEQTKEEIKEEIRENKEDIKEEKAVEKQPETIDDKEEQMSPEAVEQETEETEDEYSSFKKTNSFFYDEYEIDLLEKETQETSKYIARIYPLDITHMDVDDHTKIVLALGYDGEYKMLLTDDEMQSIKMDVNGILFVSSGKFVNGEFESRLSLRYDKETFMCTTNKKIVRPQEKTNKSHLVMKFQNDVCHIFPMESVNGRVDGLVAFLMYKNDEIFCPNIAKTVVAEKNDKKYEFIAYYMGDGLHVETPE